MTDTTIIFSNQADAFLLVRHTNFVDEVLILTSISWTGILYCY
jgi:hypothetical protein